MISGITAMGGTRYVLSKGAVACRGLPGLSSARPCPRSSKRSDIQEATLDHGLLPAVAARPSTAKFCLAPGIDLLLAYATSQACSKVRAHAKANDRIRPGITRRGRRRTPTAPQDICFRVGEFGKRSVVFFRNGLVVAIDRLRVDQSQSPSALTSQAADQPSASS